MSGWWGVDFVGGIGNVVCEGDGVSVDSEFGETRGGAVDGWWCVGLVRFDRTLLWRVF